jgi:hypothetical protein
MRSSSNGCEELSVALIEASAKYALPPGLNARAGEVIG